MRTVKERFALLFRQVGGNQQYGTGTTETGLKQMSGTVGVERIFPIESPNIDSIEVNKIGKVRRAKLYYLRKLTGKAARIKEKRSGVAAQ